ncbi:head completion/stabilization protein [Escherichia coli]|nr:head completion/stabilization protein [Escherichia coli]EFA7784048.1 head completion/stabilization protein [Escherichia coli]EFA7794589.1 head completion/stabilization protein [Escherichia coli]EFA7804603.1 head completion/stabilization protein [Escherichia coli]EFA7810163.1 head completion/stabilization protein [Escherichia coli]
MSLIAKPRVNPAETDTTDTDDGDAVVNAGDFWPVISLHELRLASRIPGRTTTSRLLHAATEAVAHVLAELETWKEERIAEGAGSLADVPATQVNGESVHIHRYRRAVFALTRAFVLERSRDVDTTEKGERKADALDMQVEDLWRDARWAISDIRCVTRIYAELV